MIRPLKHEPADILAAALTVIFTDGVGASTAKVAAAAGVSNGTLFNQFPTKQALIDALYLSIKTDLADAVGVLDPAEPLKARMRHVWDHWLAWARANPEAHAVSNLLHDSDLVSGEAVAAGYEITSAATGLLVEAQEAGLLVGLPLDYLGALTVDHLDAAVSAGLDDRQAGVAFDVLWRGLTTTT